MAVLDQEATFEMESSIRGYHIYKGVWEPHNRESLSCRRESGNVHDPYAVAMIHSSTGLVVGHVPRVISAVCSLFCYEEAPSVVL